MGDTTLYKGGNCVAYRYAIAPFAIPKPPRKKVRKHRNKMLHINATKRAEIAYQREKNTVTACLRAMREERGEFRDYESIKKHPIKIGINFAK